MVPRSVAFLKKAWASELGQLQYNSKLTCFLVLFFPVTNGLNFRKPLPSFLLSLCPVLLPSPAPRVYLHSGVFGRRPVELPLTFILLLLVWNWSPNPERRDSHAECPYPCSYLATDLRVELPYQMHLCVFKCLQSLKIWTLSVCRCALVSFYHPLFDCVFILCSGQVGFNVLLSWGCGKGQTKIPTKYCKTQNVTAVSKCANAFENSAQNLFHLENKTCNPSGRIFLPKNGENTWFPVSTLTGPACHCSACEVVLVREGKLSLSTLVSC